MVLQALLGVVKTVKVILESYDSINPDVALEVQLDSSENKVLLRGYSSVVEQLTSEK